MRARTVLLGLTAATLLVVSALAGAEEPASDSVGELAQATTQPAAGGDDATPTRAIAVLHPTEGNTVSGTITFTQVDDGIRVEAHFAGFSPGEHGFHVHEYGDCSAPDGTSAGGHFNPHGAPHGAPDSEQRHVGDLGNITAGEDGTATYDRVDSVISFEGDNDIIGRGFIVHAGADDLTTQPTGAAGARVACGVIGIAAPAE